MMEPAPKIDERTAADIAQQVQLLLKTYLKDYTTSISGSETGMNKALISIFARYAEIIIQRLNKAPEKNLLAFLKLLGASQLPPQPARVPLTFFLTKGSLTDAIVQAGTQVAKPPNKGEQDPVIFETERELVVTAGELASLFVVAPQQDTWSDRRNWLTPNHATIGFVFRGDRPIEHSFYLACEDLFTLPVTKKVTLTIQSPEIAKLAALRLIWSYGNGQDWAKIENNMISSSLISSPTGQVWQVTIGDFPLPSKRSLNGITSAWLKVQLDQALPSGSTLPSITDIKANVQVRRENLLPDLAFSNSLPLDLTKDFSAFGENPRLNDTLYLASQEVFSQAGARVTMHITLNETVPVNGSNVTLAWEAWNGTLWQPLEVSADILIAKFSQSGTVTFNLPNKMGLREENGKSNYWLRIRIIRGNYGALGTGSNQTVTFTSLSQTSQNTNDNRGRLTVNSVRGFMPGDSIQIASGGNNPDNRIIQSVDIASNSLTLTTALQNPYPAGTGVWLVNNTAVLPPLVKSLKLSYTYDVANQPLSACQTYNNFTWKNCLNVAFSPFQAPKQTKPTLYFGFNLPQNSNNSANRRFSLFVRLADLQYGEKFLPLDPIYSRQVGTTGQIAKHQIWVTNNTPDSVTWRVQVVGNSWVTNVPNLIVINGYETSRLEVGVTIPTIVTQQSEGGTTSVGDRAYLHLASPQNPNLIYSTIVETFVGQQLPAPKQVQLSWEYWNGQDWAKFNVEDGTENFTRSGLIQFLMPMDWQPKAEFEQPTSYWLRVQVVGDFLREPRIQWVALNTTWATQSVTIINEVFGSSNGSETQIFRTARFPILANQQLEVREPEKPSTQEQAQLVEEDAITEIAKSSEIWVNWQQVRDFYASKPRDRHYILNHLTGEITFGNGINGLIPPVGQGNLRMARYQIGGGATGNCQPQTIIQLKTTVPYIDRVTNYDVAKGGAEAESIDNLKERLPRSIRHGDRAVTLEDYEDLAMLASPEVARAKCVPLRNLVDDPLDLKPIVRGAVSIIIVPRSTDIKPSPSIELLNRVQEYLKNYAIATANIAVVGPLYVRVSITVDIALVSLAEVSKVKGVINQTLTRFLHPLTGGLDEKGWDFGREPHKSDFYTLLAAIPGVDYIRRLEVEVKDSEDLPGTRNTGRFLVYSGKHNINLVFES
ncbi:putative baseplate assembly protein [Anabaena azotica]|uniref:Baseplate assembly protein n=1 Tax=Anabaena azotica FACHB-119 TaxID=947527 RepID=A0ABR8DB76_9NOST|nr:putative baseplate assembly protein [Anabaena azotica]MBD2503801.1 putative baseplate assembly protein [Anabaena azotica FACHB-119]